MTTNSKPTVLIVPGAWHGSIHMGPLTEHLSSHGYPSIALDLPTAGAPDKDLYDDIVFITSHLEELISQQGKEVIVVMHSYGGIPGSSAARPFVKKERARNEKEGGVIGLLYISSWAMPAGKTVMDAAEGMDVDWMKIDAPTSTPSNATYLLYNDLPSTTAAFYASHLTTHCVIADVQPGTADCLGGVVPTTYLICEKDNVVPVWVQERNARNLGEGGRVVRCEAGHSPFLSRVEVVGGLVRRMALEEVQRGDRAEDEGWNMETTSRSLRDTNMI